MPCLPMWETFPWISFLRCTRTLGIGGGSIARISKEGKLHFGFESVGAFPGPACYNLGGTEATLTDAYLILGYFDEAYFLGGQKRIHENWARRVVQKKIADPLGVAIEEAALGMKNKAVEIIANGIRRVISVEGGNPSKFSLFAVGGGGWLHRIRSDGSCGVT